ncbi:MAG: HypC/HybG/HupF family hydrogenase formation chaperone [Verrucomicrobia bacterium]|nr:HypC/HybG/HupF family hydrogenase formation chaperone [Verrucomicrobiota bacterium]
MCLAVPMRVVSVEGTAGTVELGGVQQPVNLTLLPDVKPGEYVIVHAGFALERLDQDEARRTIELLRELDAGQDAGGSGAG